MIISLHSTLAVCSQSPLLRVQLNFSLRLLLSWLILLSTSCSDSKKARSWQQQHLQCILLLLPHNLLSPIFCSLPVQTSHCISESIRNWQRQQKRESEQESSRRPMPKCAQCVEKQERLHFLDGFQFQLHRHRHRHRHTEVNTDRHIFKQMLSDKYTHSEQQIWVRRVKVREASKQSFCSCWWQWRTRSTHTHTPS